MTPRITPFGRALWHIETHSNEELTQGGVAQVAGVSRFHLTRAFKKHFGLTPEAVRAQGHVQHLNLVEPIRMDETLLTTLEPPRFEDGRALLLAGLPSPKCDAMALKRARRS